MSDDLYEYIRRTEIKDMRRQYQIEFVLTMILVGGALIIVLAILVHMFMGS